MVTPKKMRNDKVNTKQFFIYHFYDFMFFTDLDNTVTRSRALGWLFDPALQLSNSGKFRFIELKFCAWLHLYQVIFDTKFCKNRSRPLNFRRIFIFLLFLSSRQIIKIRCFHEASSVRKPKSSNNFVKLRKQYGNPDLHPF